MATPDLGDRSVAPSHTAPSAHDIAPLEIRALTRADAHWHLEGLADLLLDGVHAGASLGYLLPLSRQEACRDWEGVQQALSDTELLWIARRDERLLGCVRLRLEAAAGDRHRATIERLVVNSRHRRQGIATALLDAVEREAAERALRLLVADVETDSAASRALCRLGWQSAGTIPGYVVAPDGTPRDAARLFKCLGMVGTST